ncbi:Eukaryotic translation initiation factor 3 subunit A-like protein [Drosera capensis]
MIIEDIKTLISCRRTTLISMETVPNPESSVKEADGTCKKEEEVPLTETAYHKRLEEEKVRHEHEQQTEVELSGQSHDHDIQEKHGLSSMLEHKSFLMEAYTCVYVMYIDITLAFFPFRKSLRHADIIHLRISEQEVISSQRAESKTLQQEQEDCIREIHQERRQEKETKTKMMSSLKSEEERLRKQQEDEEARKHEEAERRQEDAKQKAISDVIAERQLQSEQELEQMESQQREQLPVMSTDSISRPSRAPEANREDNVQGSRVPTPSPRKYVPPHMRAEHRVEQSSPSVPAGQGEGGTCHDDVQGSRAPTPSPRRYVPPNRRAEPQPPVEQSSPPVPARQGDPHPSDRR